MRILHFVTDEKFIDDMIELFDIIPNIENFYVTIYGDTKNFKFAKSHKIKRINIDWVIKNCIVHHNYDVIILHNLFSLSIDCIHQINKNIKVVWFSWGVELYDQNWPLYPLIKLKNRIKDRISLPEFIKYKSLAIKKVLYGIIVNNKFKERIHFNKTISRVDYYSGVLPIEYDLIKKNKYFNAKQIYFTYISNKYLFEPENIKSPIPSKKNIIQVGHCSSKYLNHFSVFNKLKRIESVKDFMILTPLNYGEENYKHKIIEEGEKKFGDKFFPLLNFMKSEDYYSLLSSVKIAVYNIERQSGLGNITSNLWYGTKVFLPKSSITYRHYKSLGIKIFSIEDDLREVNIVNPLEENWIYHNRRILSETSNYSKKKNRLIESLSLIKSDIEAL